MISIYLQVTGRPSFGWEVFAMFVDDALT